jgi:hypothetical protein
MNTRYVIALLAWIAVSAHAFAQQAQGTPPAPATPPATEQPFQANDIGDTTRHLLQLQASGAQAARPLPMLGDEATASYRRYLKSFEHPIPEFYTPTVGKTDNGER